MPYRILLPKDYNPKKAYPLIVFLHGSGERGKDNELQLVHGADLFLKHEVRERYPAIVVFPQCPKESAWSNVGAKQGGKNLRFVFQEKGKPTYAMSALQKLVRTLLRNYTVDRERIYIGGLSMGGMGTFEMVRRNPKTFAAAFPICGGAHPDTAAKLTGPAWWVFHGDQDGAVHHSYSQLMATALKTAGAEVKFSLYPGVGHNSWDNAFQEADLLPWMFAKSKK